MSDNMTDQLIWEKIQHKVGHFSSDFEKKIVRPMEITY